MREHFLDSWQQLINKLLGVIDRIILLLPNIALCIIVAILGYFSIRWVSHRMEKLMQKQLSSSTMAHILSRVISFFLMTGVLFLILGILNLHQLLTSLLATAGVLGLAVGLALQWPLANAFGGIILSIRERYNIGDLVKTNDHIGIIKNVNLKSTVMWEPSGQVISIPNRLVLENPIVNYSTRGKRRVELECGISYAENLRHVKKVTLQALDGIPHLEEGSIDFFYTSFGDSSINFVVWFWIEQVDQLNYFKVQSEAIMAIREAFDEHDITIPFPIRTLDFGIKGGATLSDAMQEITPQPGHNE